MLPFLRPDHLPRHRVTFGTGHPVVPPVHRAPDQVGQPGRPPRHVGQLPGLRIELLPQVQRVQPPADVRQAVPGDDPVVDLRDVLPSQVSGGQPPVVLGTLGHVSPRDAPDELVLPAQRVGGPHDALAAQFPFPARGHLLRLPLPVVRIELVRPRRVLRAVHDDQPLAVLRRPELDPGEILLGTPGPAVGLVRHDRVVHGHLLGLGDPRLEVLAVPRRDRPRLGVGHHADDRHPLPLAERAGLLILGVDPDALLPAALELAQPGRDQRPHRALPGMHHRMRRRCVLGARLRWCI